MPSYRQFSPVDTLEIKSQIFKKLGRKKAEKYFYLLTRLLSFKLTKSEFDKLCCGTIGKENVALHNLLIRSIIGNACLSHGPPSKQAATGHSQNNRSPGGHLGDLLPVSPRKGRSVTSRDRRLGDRPSPLGPHGKMVPAGSAQEVTKYREQHTAPEVISIGSKALLEVASVEEGEEVDQARSSPSVQSRSPVRPPLGVPMGSGGLPWRALRKDSSSVFHLCRSKVPQTCCSSSELPDTSSLMKQLEHRLEVEGLGLSVDCANMLNNSLDVYMKRLITPCMDLARSRVSNQKMVSRENGKFYHGMDGGWHEEQLQRSNQGYSASMTDFQASMELNPKLLGLDWPVQLEKICCRTWEE